MSISFFDFFLEGLSASAKEAAMFVKSAADKGLSERAVMSALKESPYNIKPATAHDVYLATRGIVSNRRVVQALSNNKLPTENSLSRPVFNQSRNYSYLVRVRGRNPYTGDKEEKYQSISSDTLLTKNEAINYAIYNTQRSQEGSGLIYPDEFTVIDITYQ